MNETLRGSHPLNVIFFFFKLTDLRFRIVVCEKNKQTKQQK